MHNKIIYKLAEENANMTTIDRLVNMYHLLGQTLVFEVEGDVLELGCNEGKTSVFLQMLMDYYESSKELHVYDSFQGLPKRGIHDEYLNEGDCLTSKDKLLENFKEYNLKTPFIHAGWFNETLKQIPDKISFAYLDSDFYDSIHDSLEAIYPRLTKNAIVVVDDYCDLQNNPNAWPGLPGVKKACDNFMDDKLEEFSVLVGNGDLSMAYFRKL
ncbi:hypothetical protein RW25_28450 [Bacillus sp. L_1B0_8]|uniref:TylF/MycF/NovP-related O-methyltransferase n=1 Tax=unclassified Bacillus (in: firmicutes) TaxID=185979 RepID=UPI0005B6E7D1|nr:MULTISPECIES: TylF/MycF/NovP-related O-methyltransferase [unclassified Bacillus (in: firmicutes)]KIQ77603.1 hypothetical protein RT27_30870 [Bacillus sp. L_1B0_5]KIQ78082.1 hypothetical protein RW25_28450 [Bacillus sp. L_1B0_8]